MNIQIMFLEDTSISNEQLFDLVKLAFQERKDAGLNYMCLSASISDFVLEIKDAYVLVAMDVEKNELCGCSILKVEKNKLGVLHGREKHTAVSPNYKGQGVGSKLIDTLKCKAIELGCDYLTCTTAVSAKSAVAVHVKNGYQIVGLKSFRQTNYYSYIFRMQLTPSVWKDAKYCKHQFQKSAVKTYLAYRKDGNKTCVGRLFSKIGINW